MLKINNAEKVKMKTLLFTLNYSCSFIFIRLFTRFKNPWAIHQPILGSKRNSGPMFSHQTVQTPPNKAQTKHLPSEQG